ncbi:MAG: hypothetical protein CFH06_01147 [Alphaproteobacteria bacterium MarineAlpha3_Bin5]|nr:hypothetical protein [Magnetovibrio sp.]PPR77699.1 MAG: hypothetical protein CFH06_01147 [Alphaproteobacteria bacterium MarineAlpha3_Bin5]
MLNEQTNNPVFISIWKKLPSIILIFTFFFIVLTRFQSFGPPYNIYLPIIYFVKNPGVFPVDPFFPNSVYLQASIYYKLITYFNIPIENDLFALLIHTFLSGTLIWFIAKTILRHFSLSEIETAVCITFICCFLHSQFVIGSRPSIISIVSSSPTGFAHILGLFAFFSLLRERVLPAALLATLCIALSPKGHVILIPILALFIFINSNVSLQKTLYLLIPIGYITWILLTGEKNTLSHSQLVELTKQLILREEEDASFAKQPLLTHILLFSSFIFFVFYIKRFQSSSLKALGWATFLCTLATYFGGLIYPIIGYKFLPIPELIILSPCQNTRYFALFVVLMALTLLLKNSYFACHEKVAIVTSIIILKPFYPQIFIAAAIIVLFVLLPRYFFHIRPYYIDRIYLIRKFEQIPISIIFCGLLISYTLARMPQNYVAPSWIDLVAYKFSSTWSGQVWASEATWLAWSKVRQIKNDFVFLAIYENQRFNLTPIGGVDNKLYVEHGSANIHANKSPFRQIPVHGYLNPDLWKLGHKQDIISNLILERVNNLEPLRDKEWIGSLPSVKEGIPITFNQTLGNYLKKLKCVIMVPKSLEHLFFTNTPRISIDDFTLFSYGVDIPQ